MIRRELEGQLESANHERNIALERVDQAIEEANKEALAKVSDDVIMSHIILQKFQIRDAENSLASHKQEIAELKEKIFEQNHLIKEIDPLKEEISELKEKISEQNTPQSLSTFLKKEDNKGEDK